MYICAPPLLYDTILEHPALLLLLTSHSPSHSTSSPTMVQPEDSDQRPFLARLPSDPPHLIHAIFLVVTVNLLCFMLCFATPSLLLVVIASKIFGPFLLESTKLWLRMAIDIVFGTWIVYAFASTGLVLGYEVQRALRRGRDNAPLLDLILGRLLVNSLWSFLLCGWCLVLKLVYYDVTGLMPTCTLLAVHRITEISLLIFVGHALVCMGILGCAELHDFLDVAWHLAWTYVLLRSIAERLDDTLQKLLATERGRMFLGLASIL